MVLIDLYYLALFDIDDRTLTVDVGNFEGSPPAKSESTGINTINIIGR